MLSEITKAWREEVEAAKQRSPDEAIKLAFVNGVCCGLLGFVALHILAQCLGLVVSFLMQLAL